MKKFTLLASLLMFVMFSYAASVIPVEDAMRASKNFLSERVGAAKAGQMELVLAHTEYSPDGTPVTYRFSIGDKGFIIVSATDASTPVLAYSLESNYIEGTGVEVFNERYTKSLSYLINHPEAVSLSAQKSWKHYLTSEFKPYETKGDPCVEPLVTTTWNQGKYYNALTPNNPKCTYSEDCHVVVGCVAVTMANLLYYYRFPEQGSGSSIYFPQPDSIGGDATYSYPRQYANYGATIYNYDAVTSKTLNKYDGELAKLLYHSGVSVRMGYGWQSSGAFSADVPDALKNYFRFSDAGQFQQEDDTVSYPGQHQLWVPKAIEELNAHRPLYYSGRSQTGGHAWIVDGYTTIEDETYFHANFGWDGQGNGFFILTHQYDASDHSESGEFNLSNGMGIRLMPDSIDIVKPAESFKRVTASLGSISDGAGNMKYAKGSNRQWMIACPDAATYKFQFSKLKVKEGDKVTVYNGPSINDTKREFSGNYLMPACNDYSSSGTGHHGDYTGQPLPSAFTVNADSVLVVFTSAEDSETDFGFVLEYEVTSFDGSKQICQDLTLTSQSAVLTDKANNAISDETYRASTVCEYTLKLSWTNQLVYAFPKFDLKGGDFVDIYNQETRFENSKKLVAHYDIYNQPNTTYTCDVPIYTTPSGDTISKFIIRFVSDNYDQGTGFELEYYGIRTNINNYENVNVNVYPNPATSYLNVDITSDDAQQFKAEVVDMMGKTVYIDQFNHNGGTQNYQISVSNLAKGVYFLHLDNQNGRHIQKFVVR